MVKRYPAYLFDLDGTLVDTAPDINAALNHALGVAGLDGVDEALTRHWVGHGGQVLIEQALHHQGGPEDVVPDVLREFIAYYEAHIADRSVPYPHVVESLEALRARGARLAVVTNKRTRLSIPLLDALGLRHLFHTVVCGDTAERPKPAPDPALHACAALGVAAADALFVGDSETDVACARAAGCPVVVVPDGYNHGIAPAELGADAVIDSFRELV
ncbi:MAG TPA: phosphoglycolate phosphatase [Pseudomonadales bacterium]